MRKICCIMLAMLVLMTGGMASADSSYAPVALTEEEKAAANLFLSNFTEVGVRCIEDWLPEKELVDFAHDHMWFNDPSAFEYGEYFAGNNCRVSDDRIQEIVDKYFLDPPQVDLAQTRFDYVDGYYYHCETGGWTSGGFAHVVNVCPIGEDKYFVAFMVFGGGEAWDNDVLDDSLAEIEAAYGHPNGYGSALIHASDLSDRATYTLLSYSRI